jgi:FSR family fosmidomycin resistance protein-like MFS transporter
VVGLAAGGALAAGGYLPIWPLLLVLGALMFAILELKLPVLPYKWTIDDRRLTIDNSQPSSLVLRPSSPHHFEGHDLVMLALLAAIALRSAVWSSLEFLFAGRYELLLAMALAAALGKVAGGALADWIGWRRWAFGSLALAAPLLALGSQHMIALLAGIALLQSATPVALAASARLLPGRPATAAGLALGLAIAIGGLPVASGLGAAIGAPVSLAALLTAAALALWWAVRQATGGWRQGAAAYTTASKL